MRTTDCRFNAHFLSWLAYSLQPYTHLIPIYNRNLLYVLIVSLGCFICLYLAFHQPHWFRFRYRLSREAWNARRAAILPENRKWLLYTTWSGLPSFRSLFLYISSWLQWGDPPEDVYEDETRRVGPYCRHTFTALILRISCECISFFHKFCTCFTELHYVAFFLPVYCTILLSVSQHHPEGPTRIQFALWSPSIPLLRNIYHHPPPKLHVTQSGVCPLGST